MTPSRYELSFPMEDETEVQVVVPAWLLTSIFRAYERAIVEGTIPAGHRVYVRTLDDSDPRAVDTVDSVGDRLRRKPL